MKKEWFEPGPDGTRADRRQGMSEINHEAAKNVYNARLAHDMHPSRSDQNIASAYLDLSAQLTAERARVEALAGLVREAFIEAAYCYEELPKSCEHYWNESEVNQQLTAILEGRNAHAQGDDA